MDPGLSNGSVKAGTVGGTLAAIFLSVDYNEISKTVSMAAIGAVVSFIVSAILKIIIRKFFRK
jgi:hypothetical protein